MLSMLAEKSSSGQMFWISKILLYYLFSFVLKTTCTLYIFPIIIIFYSKNGYIDIGNFTFCLVTLFNGISIFVGYLMPKPVS